MNAKETLKADYRHNWPKLRKMGVYQIKNQVNGKVFLAASLNLEGTVERDRAWLPRGGHTNHKLQQDWKAFGADAFTFEILETLTPTDEPRDYAAEAALLLEAWKAQLEPYGDKGYLPPPRR
ncbi:GIY-YIG nuclease family protein [bacterium]|nr:GIY-YIG nuclease family protein [bacterium]